jgi:hypothetical protein
VFRHSRWVPLEGDDIPTFGDRREDNRIAEQSATAGDEEASLGS